MGYLDFVHRLNITGWYLLLPNLMGLICLADWLL